MKFSIVIPVYNRPDELDELLSSLEIQSCSDFEVIVVEDGSSITSEEVFLKHRDRLALSYLKKDNSGPGLSRNAGVGAARGEWIIILDSDCVVPQGYIQAASEAIEEFCPDAFGGPDRAADDFSDKQKAISRSMTSFFTTGGIRGGNEKMDRFYPRSFNMGVKKSVYDALGGFSAMRFGEDIDFSYRLVEAGYRSILAKNAWVWHKRRTDFRKFFRQVFNSGIARINLSLRHKGTFKAVHLLPAAFTLGCILLLAASAFFAAAVSPLAALAALSPLILYSLLVFADSALYYRNAKVAALTVPAAFIQLIGYGLGFISAFIKRVILKREYSSAFRENFYK